MPIEAIFPTPIYHSGTRNLDAITKEIDDALDSIQFSYKPEWGKTHHLSDTTFTKNFIVDNSLNLLHDEIRYHVSLYLNGLRFPKPKDYDIIGSWVALFKPGDYGHIHNHAYFDISGVYYHKTNGNDGNIYFNTPNTLLDASYCFNHISPPWSHSPQKGKIILFPSFISHGIKTNETDDDRISIAFNIQFKYQ